jgi:hypothetical protein
MDRVAVVLSILLAFAWGPPATLAHPRPLPAQHHQPRPRQQRLPHRLRRQRRQARPLRPASPRRKAHRPPA